VLFSPDRTAAIERRHAIPPAHSNDGGLMPFLWHAYYEPIQRCHAADSAVPQPNAGASKRQFHD
jgi:hypothetical protein